MPCAMNMPGNCGAYKHNRDWGPRPRWLAIVAHLVGLYSRDCETYPTSILGASPHRHTHINTHTYIDIHVQMQKVNFRQWREMFIFCIVFLSFIKILILKIYNLKIWASYFSEGFFFPNRIAVFFLPESICHPKIGTGLSLPKEFWHLNNHIISAYDP